jgi:hypothetical protein
MLIVRLEGNKGEVIFVLLRAFATIRAQTERSNSGGEESF